MQIVGRQVLPGVCFTPRWQQHGGANDRIALGSAQVMRAVGFRMDNVRSYISSGRRLHSEQLLGHVVSEVYNFTTSELLVKCVRIRCDNRIDFRDIKLSDPNVSVEDISFTCRVGCPDDQEGLRVASMFEQLRQPRTAAPTEAPVLASSSPIQGSVSGPTAVATLKRERRTDPVPGGALSYAF